MLSYDLVEHGTIDGQPVSYVWINGLSPESAGLQVRREKARGFVDDELGYLRHDALVGEYVGRVFLSRETNRWIAVPSFVGSDGDPHGDVEIDAFDVDLYQDFKTRKKAIEHLRKTADACHELLA